MKNNPPTNDEILDSLSGSVNILSKIRALESKLEQQALAGDIEGFHATLEQIHAANNEGKLACNGLAIVLGLLKS